jgi:hypothetical protein
MLTLRRARQVGPSLREVGLALRDFVANQPHRVGHMTQDEQRDVANIDALDLLRSRLVAFETTLRRLERAGRTVGAGAR